MHFTTIFSLSLAALASAAPNPEPQGGGYYLRETFAEDPSNPYQVYFYKQLSDRVICGDDDGTTGCTVGETQLETYSVSWGADISAAGWISAGFSVSKGETTGNTYTCNNEVDGELKKNICVWRRMGYTEYTVADWKKWNVGGTWEQESDAYQMWSPNTDGVGCDYVCAWDDDCDNKGAEWWGPSRTEGGPAQYPFDDDKWQ